MMRKKCSQHGLVIRNDAKHCPACGEELLVISVFPFKIYFSRTAAFFFTFPMFCFGLIFAFDMPGGISGCNQRNREAAIVEQARLVELIETFPPYWKNIYLSFQPLSCYSRWRMLKERLYHQEDHSLPRMNGNQQAAFIGQFGSDYELRSSKLLNRIMLENFP